MASCAEGLRILSRIPGRMRLHLAGWTADERDKLEARLGRVNGVARVRANPLTQNVLLYFDRGATEEQELLAEVQRAWNALRSCAPGTTTGGAVCGERGPSLLLRIGLRGLLGHAAVDSLWFAAGFLGKAVGLPLAGLGPLHLLTDVVVWGAALGSARLDGAQAPGA
jgi:hypothetical protein